MKFRIARADLLPDLTAVASVANDRMNIPVVAALRIGVLDGILSLSATDMTMAASTTTKVEQDGSTSGECAPNAARLLSVIRNLPADAVIDFSLSGDTLSVRSGGASARIPCLPISDIPAMRVVEPEAEFTIPAKDLRRLIDHTMPFIPATDTRYYLHGVFLTLDNFNEKLAAAGTHGNALSEVRIPIPDGAQSMPSIIIPRASIIAFRPRLTAQDVRMQVSSKSITITQGNYTFSSKLIDGIFPDYRMAMPQPSGISVTIKKDALNSALNMVSVMSEHAVFEPGDNEIKITSRPGAPLETGKGNSESILSGDDVKISGKMEPFGINISYLRAASDLCAEYIIIDMASGGAPALIRDPDAPDCTYVVMPCRI